MNSQIEYQCLQKINELRGNTGKLPYTKNKIEQLKKEIITNAWNIDMSH